MTSISYQRVTLIYRLLKIFKITDLVSLCRADPLVTCHVLSCPKITPLKLQCYNALTDMPAAADLRAYLPQCPDQVHETVFHLRRSVHADKKLTA